MGSETPKCDAAEFDWTATCRGEAPDKPANVVDASFARTLEAEAARLRKERERAQAVIAAALLVKRHIGYDARNPGRKMPMIAIGSEGAACDAIAELWTALGAYFSDDAALSGETR